LDLGERSRPNEELRNVYASPNITREIKLRMMMWVRHTARMAEMRNADTVLVGKTGRKRPRVETTWEDNIRTDLKKIW
jgi:hypothetical protein